MCRILAYLGEALPLQTLLFDTDNSLVRQSYSPQLMNTFLNLAGFGMKAWDPAVATVPVKFANDRFAAQLVPVAEAREAIETTTADALRSLPTPDAPTGPRTLAVRWQSASVASHLTAIPGVTRQDDRTVTLEADMLQLYRMFNLFLRVCSAVTSNPPYC